MAILFVAASSQLVSMGSGSSALNAVTAATLMGWIKPASLPAGLTVVIGLSNGLAAGSSRAKLGFTGNQIKGNGRCLDADANQTQLGTAALVSTGSWQHIAATFDYTNKIIRLYYNGVLDVTSAAVTWGAAPTSATNSLGFNMGSQHGGGSEFFDGSIDDARVYNRLLSDNEIKTIFVSRGVDEIANGLQHRFLLSEGAPGVTATGSVIIDVAVRKMNGTPGGTTNPAWAASSIRFRRKIAS